MQNSFLDYMFSLAENNLYARIDSAGNIFTTELGSSELMLDENLEDFSELAPSSKQFLQDTDSPFMVYPLSAAQLSVYYENQLRPESSAYQVNAPILFLSEITPEQVIQSFEKVHNRHAALRTTFRRFGDQYIQHIQMHIQPQIVLREMNDGTPETAEDAMRKDVGIPIDISKSSYVLYIYTFDQKAIACSLVVHHAVADLYGAMLVIEEWHQLFVGQEPPPVDDRYIAFIRAQIENEQGTLAERNRLYWLKQLTPLPKATELPTDYRHASYHRHDSADYSFHGSVTLREQVKSLADAHNTDVQTVALTLFQVFLARYTGDWDTNVTIVMPTSARRKFSKLVGYGVQEVPLLAEINSQVTFNELLAESRGGQLQLYKHRDFSLLNLSSELGIVHDTSRAAIAQISFISYPEKGQSSYAPFLSMCAMGYRSLPMEYEGFQFAFLNAMVPHWPYELSLIGGWHPDGLLPLVFRYHTTLFTPETIARMAHNFLVLLQEAVSHPDKSVADLQLLDSEEENLLAEWGMNPQPIVEDQLIPDLFEVQAAENPEAPALVIADHELTYQQLNQQANIIAHYLQDVHKVQEETTVGLLFEPSPEMIFSILGILKAGAAFVPIDPEIPQARIHQIAQDANLKVILSHKPLFNQTQILDLELVDVVELLEQNHARTQPNPVRALSPENLAYIFFTSGSTGTPKGVMLQHDSFLASQLSWNISPGVNSDDRVLSVYNYAFDASLGTNIAPLIAGACVVLATKEERQDPRLLIKLMEDQSVTFTCATTSHYRLLMMGGWHGSSQLRAASAGEAFGDEVASFLLDTCKEVWNAYGPTEGANIVSSYQLVTNNLSIPIGTPAANVKLYVLDDRLRKVPIGVRGQLAIGGVYVSRGYINNPDLTDKFFVTDPFANDLKARIYLTGDVASFRSDGLILYHGRNDTQVKIRGYRIETKEIEHAINQLPGVSTSIVRPYTMPNQLTNLVAYIVPEFPSEIDVQSVQDRLINLFPSYMLPEPILFIEDLPLNQNGKLVVSALPNPNIELKLGNLRVTEAEFQEDELIVLAIWERVLGKRAFHSSDDFFEVGGDSLSLMSVVLELEKITGTQIPLVSILKATSIQGMARLLKETEGNDAESWEILIPIKTSGNKTPIFCIAAGLGDLIAYQKWDNLLGADQPFYVLQPPRSQPRNFDVPSLVVAYLDAIQTIQPMGSYKIVGHSFSGLLALEVARQLIASGQLIESLFLIETLPSIPVEFQKFLEWLGSIMGAGESKTSIRSYVEAMLQDEGWLIHFEVLKGFQPTSYPGDVTMVLTGLAKSFLRIRRWQQLVTGQLKIVEMNGNHHSIIRDQALELVEMFSAQ